MDSTTAALLVSVIFSGLFTAVLIRLRHPATPLLKGAGNSSREARELGKPTADHQPDTGQKTTSLTNATKTFDSSVQALTSATHSLAKIEVEPRLEYKMVKKDLTLGGIEFELYNRGKGTAHSLKVTPVSSKGTRLGVSFLTVQRTDVSVGEARSMLLTSVKQGDLISLNVEYKNDFGDPCTPQTFNVDTA